MDEENKVLKGILNRANGTRTKKKVTFQPMVEQNLRRKEKARQRGGQKNNNVEYSVSPFTLRLSEVTMDQEFISYLRKEVRKRGLGVLIVNFVIVMILVIFYIELLDNPDKSGDITHLLILLGMAMVALAIA